ncbi:MAG: putative HNHc nuclease [Sphingomicrobium sp.]
MRRHHCSVPRCDRLPIECAHVRIGTDGGAGLKPSDRWVISLCRSHHREQHEIGELSFEEKYSIDLQALAREFVRRSPHKQKLEAEGPPSDQRRCHHLVGPRPRAVC